MNPNREEDLFAVTLEKPAAKRAAFLDVMCEGDTALRQRLEVLLIPYDMIQMNPPEKQFSVEPRSVKTKFLSNVGRWDCRRGHPRGCRARPFALIAKIATAVIVPNLLAEMPRRRPHRDAQTDGQKYVHDLFILFVRGTRM